MCIQGAPQCPATWWIRHVNAMCLILSSPRQYRLCRAVPCALAIAVLQPGGMAVLNASCLLLLHAGGNQTANALPAQSPAPNAGEVIGGSQAASCDPAGGTAVSTVSVLQHQGHLRPACQLPTATWTHCRQSAPTPLLMIAALEILQARLSLYIAAFVWCVCRHNTSCLCWCFACRVA